MQKVMNQYKTLLGVLISLAILLQYFVLQWIKPFLDQSLKGSSPTLALAVEALTFLGTSTSIYILLCRGGLLWYEHVGWKVLNPDIDLSGKWTAEFFYNPETGNPVKGQSVPATGGLTIEQTWYGALSISGSYSYKSETGIANSFWRTQSCSIIQNEAGSPTLIFTYVTHRSGDETFYKPGEGVRGVVEMWFEDQDHKGRPTKLEGPFFNFFGAGRRGLAILHRNNPKSSKST